MKRSACIFILVLMLFSCGKSTRHVRVGDTVSLTTETVGTFDERTLDAIVMYSESHDDSSVNRIIESGDAVVLKKGMGGVVRHARVGKVQIELLSGKSVWVLYEHIR